MTKEIRVRAGILNEMIHHTQREPETECCGLLAGRDNIITHIFPTQNALGSATTYEIAPQELFQLFRRLREEGLHHLGQYHSHLRSDNFPSPTDIAQAYYPEQPYFIVSPSPGAPNPVRAFLISDGNVTEMKIEIVADL